MTAKIGLHCKSMGNMIFPVDRVQVSGFCCMAILSTTWNGRMQGLVLHSPVSDPIVFQEWLSLD